MVVRYVAAVVRGRSWVEDLRALHAVDLLDGPAGIGRDIPARLWGSAVGCPEGYRWIYLDVPTTVEAPRVGSKELRLVA